MSDTVEFPWIRRADDAHATRIAKATLLLLQLLLVGCAAPPAYVPSVVPASPTYPQQVPTSMLRRQPPCEVLVVEGQGPVCSENAALGEALVLFPGPMYPLLPVTPPEEQPLYSSLLKDQRNFYSADSLTLMGGGLAVGAIMANTSIDEEIHRRFQTSVRGATSDEWFEFLHTNKELGNGIYTLPIFASAWAFGEVFPDSQAAQTTATWGERSLRGFVVGAPPLMGLQRLTGGSRPGESERGSHWKPFDDNNGISGHSFMGALPFITAAKMTESPGLKTTFYAASLLAPLSRVNDDAHYPSQVALGWWTAYLAARAVVATDDSDARWTFVPYSTDVGYGVLGEFNY